MRRNHVKKPEEGTLKCPNRQCPDYLKYDYPNNFKQEVGDYDFDESTVRCEFRDGDCDGDDHKGRQFSKDGEWQPQDLHELMRAVIKHPKHDFALPGP
jgi:hypothetical protein